MPTAEVTEPVPSCEVTAPEGWILYTVLEGDTLEALVAVTGVPLPDLMQINCLIAPLVVPGQMIWLPFTPSVSP